MGSQINETSIIDLEKSDIIIDKYYKQYEDSRTEGKIFLKKIPAANIDEIKSTYDFVIEEFDDEVYYFNKDSKYYGAFIIPIEYFIKDEVFFALIGLEGDSFNLVSKDFKKGILIDFFEEDFNWFYEFNKWSY